MAPAMTVVFHLGVLVAIPQTGDFETTSVQFFTISGVICESIHAQTTQRTCRRDVSL